MLCSALPWPKIGIIENSDSPVGDDKTQSKVATAEIRRIPMRPFSIASLLFVVVAYFGMTIPIYGDPPSVGQPESVQEKQNRLRNQPLPYDLGDVPPKIEVNRWTDGRQHSLDEFRGKVVVIEFTGIWCGICRRSAPTMRELVEHYKGEDNRREVALVRDYP